MNDEWFFCGNEGTKKFLYTSFFISLSENKSKSERRHFIVAKGLFKKTVKTLIWPIFGVFQPFRWETNGLGRFFSHIPLFTNYLHPR